MKINRSITFSAIVLSLVLILSTAFKGEKDPLHKRDFTIGLTEVKDGQPQKKNISDVLSFKDGKLYSGFLNDKYGSKWLKYRINKDSIYVDAESNAEVRMIVVECVTTDESNTTTAINLVIEDWDLEGTIKITKNDKPKRYYDLVGFAKGGKPKKMKKEDKAKAAGTMEEPKKE